MQARIHKLLYRQMMVDASIEEKLKSLCVFPKTDTAIKTRQLSGLGKFLLSNIDYLFEKLRKVDDKLLKMHLLDEIQLVFKKMKIIFSTFVLMKIQISNPTLLLHGFTKDPNNKLNDKSKGANTKDREEAINENEDADSSLAEQDVVIVDYQHFSG